MFHVDFFAPVRSINTRVAPLARWLQDLQTAKAVVLTNNQADDPLVNLKPRSAQLIEKNKKVVAKSMNIGTFQQTTFVQKEHISGTVYSEEIAVVSEGNHNKKDLVKLATTAKNEKMIDRLLLKDDFEIDDEDKN